MTADVSNVFQLHNVMVLGRDRARGTLNGQVKVYASFRGLNLVTVLLSLWCRPANAIFVFNIIWYCTCIWLSNIKSFPLETRYIGHTILYEILHLNVNGYLYVVATMLLWKLLAKYCLSGNFDSINYLGLLGSKPCTQITSLCRSISKLSLKCIRFG